MAKKQDLNEMSDEELARQLAESKEEIFNLRFQLVTGQLDNPMRIKQVRKDIARIFTAMRAREIAAVASAAGEEN